MSDAKKVLLVDDEPLGLKILRHYLSDSGYQVECAENGLQAWASLTDPASTKFQVVILDWVMPKMNGIELLRKMQASQALCQIPVIMLTGVDEKEDIIEAVQAGVFDYLIKPVEKELFIAMVDRAIRKNN